MPEEQEQSLTEIIVLIASLFATTNWREHYGSQDDLSRDILDYGLATLIFLVASDNKLSDEEVGLVREFIGSSVGYSEALEWVRSHQATAFQTLSSVPKFFRVLADYDSQHGTDLSNGCLGLLACYAVKIVSVDGNVSATESQQVSGVLAILTAHLDSKGLPWTLPFADVQPEEAKEHCKSSQPAKDLDTFLQELDSLIGLEEVKREVKGLINLIKVRRMREERGIKSPPISLHLVFSGNPGTGKTTVARLLGNIYKALGVLSKGHLVEVDRSGLVAGYVGQTAIKVKEVVDRALGGVLFIDEAYSLASKSELDFGREAVEILLKAMEDNRGDFVVIAAGYTEKMKEFLEINPGLRSRFNKFIQFQDYSSEELTQIFDRICNANGYRFTSDFLAKICEILTVESDLRDEGFANARSARNLFERVVSNHSNRIAAILSPTDVELITFTLQDISGANSSA